MNKSGLNLRSGHPSVSNSELRPVRLLYRALPAAYSSTVRLLMIAIINDIAVKDGGAD
jgi:hypothetical protein